MSKNPYKTWWSSNPTAIVSITTYNWIGGEFAFDTPGRVFGLRAFIPAGSSIPRTGQIWQGGQTTLLGNLLLHQIAPATSQWQNAYFKKAIRIVPGSPYLVAVLLKGNYGRTPTAFAAGSIAHGHITMFGSFNNTFVSPIDNPPTLNTNANGVDVIFLPDSGV